MDIAELIRHPRQLDRETLYELRSLLALYPYFQSARLLLLQNLFLLHDPTFDEELRTAAIYIADRSILFQMIEASHYRLNTRKDTAPAAQPLSPADRDSRTLSLIDDFLDSIPKDEPSPAEKTRKPTPADAAVDYVAYLLQNENDDDRETAEQAPQLIGQELIDTFIENDKHKIVLNSNPTLLPARHRRKQ